MAPTLYDRVKERKLTTSNPSPALDKDKVPKKDEEKTPVSDEFNEYDFTDTPDGDDTQW